MPALTNPSFVATQKKPNSSETGAAGTVAGGADNATGTDFPNVLDPSSSASGPYEWNLPPHKWSLPVKPQTIESLVGSSGPSVTAYQGSSLVTSSFLLPDNLRRGRLWYFAGSANISKVGVTKKAADTSQPTASYTYGFQFMWNPNAISSSVNMNTDFTPGTGDIFKTVAGAYPSQETLTFTITIDRTNDVACFKNAQTSLTDAYVSDYYGSFYPGAKQPSISNQVKEIMKKGTMHDIEYLFKSQNGYSETDPFYTNLLKRRTADVGYLVPNLIAMQLGPTLDSLSYVGYLNSIAVNHTSFTEGMIPLRSEVTITFACFSGSGVQSSA
jgi:hypothetical protein